MTVSRFGIPHAGIFFTTKACCCACPKNGFRAVAFHVLELFFAKVIILASEIVQVMGGQMARDITIFINLPPLK